MKFTKKPVAIEATQWFRNGDHPEDNANGGEGAVVRYYRHPGVDGGTPCEQCGVRYHEHGWIDTLAQGHRVCPGDWIITGVKGERYPCKPDIFERTYTPACTTCGGTGGVQTYIDGGLESSEPCPTCGPVVCNTESPPQNFPDTLKKIREALSRSAQISGNKPASQYGMAMRAEEALRLFDAHVASLSRQKAEPVTAVQEFAKYAKNKLGQQGYIDELASAFLEQMRRGVVPGVAKPAPLPQPVEVAAEKLWNSYRHNHPSLGLKDLPSWIDLPDEEKARWRAKAQPVASVPQGLEDYVASVFEAVDISRYSGIALQNLVCTALSNFVTQREAAKSVPQGLEEFIATHVIRPFDSSSSWVPEEDLRTWMAGHARVPVGLATFLKDREELECILEYVLQEEQTINVGPVQQNEHDEFIESSAGWLARLLRTMIAASQGGV